VAETVYNRGKYLLAHSGMNGRDLRMCVILGTTTGVDNVDLNTVADLDAVSGVSIHSERVALANETVTEDDANNRANLDADAVVFAAAAGVTAVGVAIYVEGANDAARELVSSHTTGFPQPMDGGLTINIADWLRAS
jgi:hypothetical protein